MRVLHHSPASAPAAAPATGSRLDHVAAPVSPVISGVANTPVASPTRAASPPVHLTISAIGVSTALEPLPLKADGTLQSPQPWGEAGWYSGGIVPGQIGPAVIAGHIDSINGPAVFYRLDRLVPGDSVSITAQDGSELTFVVDRSAAYPKTQFPTQLVYGPTATAQLRLISCTGDFDWKTHNYLDNLVVFAHLV